MKTGKQRILILVLLSLVLLGVGGTVAFFLVGAKNKVATMQSALDAYERKDYDNAIRLFKDVLSNDPDNEKAVSALAEIYCAMEDWNMSSLYWRQACRLNNLNPEYEKSFVTMSLRGRFFNRVIPLYTDSRHTKLNLDEQLVLAYCLLMSRERNKGIELWKKIVAENPDAAEKPYGKLISTTHFAANLTFETAFKDLDALIASEDTNISQEALIALSRLNKMVRRYENEEENLKKLTAANFFVGAPMLGEFYSNHSKFVESIDVFEKFIEKYPNGRIAMVLGELLLFTSQQEKLGTLTTEWKKKTSKANISAAYYLASLYALSRHNLNEVATAYQPIRGQVNTPLSAFIAMLCDVNANDTYHLEEDLRWFQKFPPLFDLRTRMHTLVMLYLQDRIKAGAPAKELQHLAEFLLNEKVAEDSSAVPLLVSLIAKLQNNSLTEADLKTTMEKLPDDPTSIGVAIGFHYSRGNFAESKKYLDQLEKIEKGKVSRNIQQLAINIHTALGNIDEATARFFALLEEDKSAGTFISCFLFCFDNGRKDDLRKLAEKAGDDKDLAPIKQFCNAGIQLLDGAKDAALDALAGIDTTDDRLLFFAGRTLAANGRQTQAIEKLTKVNRNFSGYITVLAMLSSIYLDMGDSTKAKASAEQALALAPSSPELKGLLAACFRAEDNWKKALENAAPALWENNGNEKLRGIWIWAMEKNIAAEFNAHQYSVTKRLCATLMQYDKDNKVGTEYLAKAEEMIEQEKKPRAE